MAIRVSGTRTYCTEAEQRQRQRQRQANRQPDAGQRAHLDSSEVHACCSARCFCCSVALGGGWSVMAPAGLVVLSLSTSCVKADCSELSRCTSEAAISSALPPIAAHENPMRKERVAVWCGLRLSGVGCVTASSPPPPAAPHAAPAPAAHLSHRPHHCLAASRQRRSG